jgi:hypothetical protein
LMKKENISEILIECVMCKDNNVNVCIVPCGHMGCHKCIVNYDKNICFLCKQVIKCKVFVNG